MNREARCNRKSRLSYTLFEASAPIIRLCMNFGDFPVVQTIAKKVALYLE